MCCSPPTSPASRSTFDDAQGVRVWNLLREVLEELGPLKKASGAADIRRVIN